MRWGWIPRNPALGVDLPGRAPTALRIPTPDDVRSLMQAIDALDQRLGILIALAVATAARRGELCALRWTDIEGSLVRFRRSLYRAGAERGEKGLKHGAEKVVHLGPTMVARLADWRRQCEEKAASLDLRLVDDAYVAASLPTGSRPTDPDELSRVVRRLCDDLGLPHVHVHSLRHFAVTEMLAAGVDVRNVAEVAGHANSTMTLTVYAHPTAERQRAATAVLDRVLMPAESPPVAPLPAPVTVT